MALCGWLRPARVLKLRADDRKLTENGSRLKCSNLARRIKIGRLREGRGAHGGGVDSGDVGGEAELRVCSGTALRWSPATAK